MSDRATIDVEVLHLGYAMSRLDREFLDRLGFESWRAAFGRVHDQFGVKASSVKNVRDEFDLLHPHRVGHKKTLPPSRVSVVEDCAGLSDAELLEVVQGILDGEFEEARRIGGRLRRRPSASAAAQRLRTGMFAEKYFLAHAKRICGIAAERLVDVRYGAAGFDFASASRPRLAIEVKGLQAKRGLILFTDHEWRTARARGADYWVVVIGDIAVRPRSRVIVDPAAEIEVAARVERRVARSWVGKVAVA
jgi:Protein NO VEIN, C-terminal